MLRIPKREKGLSRSDILRIVVLIGEISFERRMETIFNANDLCSFIMLLEQWRMKGLKINSALNRNRTLTSTSTLTSRSTIHGLMIDTHNGPALSLPDSSTGGALHRHRRLHVFF